MKHFSLPLSLCLVFSLLVLKVTCGQNYTVSTFAGSSAGYVDANGIEAQFRDLSQIAIDLQGNIFVADRFNHCIRKVSPSGNVTTIAGSGVSGFLDSENSNEAK